MFEKGKVPEDACRRTTKPVGRSSVEGPLCPQITQSYRTSDSITSVDPKSMAASVSGDSGKQINENIFIYFYKHKISNLKNGYK